MIVLFSFFAIADENNIKDSIVFGYAFGTNIKM